MRIAVVGLGGVGAYIGARLCTLKDEHEIIFVARGEHLHAIKENGLRLINVDREELYFPTEAVQDLNEPVDILFLCTKSYHSQETISQLHGAINEKTLVIPVANGVNNCELIRGLTSARLADACVYIVSHKVEAGVIKKSTDSFALILSDELKELLGPLFEKASLRCKFSPDIKKELWKKFLFISAMGSLTSYYGMGMGDIYKAHKDELSSLLKEIFSVAKAEGISLEEKEMDKALHTASKLPSQAPTSLWLDLQKGGNNELQSLCHYVILAAKPHGIQTPLMQKIYEKLK